MRWSVAFAAAVTAAVLGFGAPGEARAEELRIGLGAEVSSIDPHYHNLDPNNALAMNFFDTLVIPDEQQKLKPGLAESWKAIDDKTWEFKLRKGVKFHNGQPFTADDVVFTFKRAPNVPNSPSGFGIYARGKTVEKVDDHTVLFKTAAPYPLMPNDLSTIYIISQSVGDGVKTEDFNSGKATFGTGPYRFVEYVPGDRIVMTRNDDYWGPKPVWTKVTLKPIKAGPSRVAALLAGDVDAIEQVPTIDIARLKKEPKVTLSDGISNRVVYLATDQFRETTPFVKGKDGSAIKNPFLDKRVRVALSKAINRDVIVSRVMEGVAIPAGQLLPDGFFGVSPKLKPMAYDPEGAKKLLAEAGLPNGFKVTIHGPNGRYINDAKIVEAVAQMLNRVGIEASVETLPPSVFFTRASTGGPDKGPEFSFILVGWGAGTGEASSPLKSLIASFDREKGNGPSNRGRYSNKEVDKLIEEAVVTIDDAKRQDLLARATEIAMEDVAIIPTHYQVNTWAAKKGLRIKPRTDERTLVISVVKE